ncbi:MAG: Pvc16 family protein [Acidimicrobiia bacterium]
MSDFRAIGGVSATLQTLLSDRMELPDGVPAVPVTVGPPAFSSKDVDPRKEDPRVNLFLYRVTENAYLQNQEIGGRGAPPSAYGHPPLSLNLHYMLTTYGNAEMSGGNGASLFTDTTAHFLLGSAMRVLHDVPVITDGVTTSRPPSGSSVLHESLRDEFERVKLSLEPLTLEDITKVWAALALRYRLSAAYVVNVVQIESRRKRTFPRPVGQPVSATTPPLPSDPPSPGPMVYVLTIQTPTITDLKVIRVGDTVEQPFAYARIGDTLVLRGTFLSGPITSVAFGDVVVPASMANPERVQAVIPDASLPDGGSIPPDLRLQPGVRTASVVVRDPLVPHRTFKSNEAAFMLIPAVNPGAVAYAAGPPRTLTVTGTRLTSGSPGGEMIIGRSAVSRGAYIMESPTQVVVPVPDALPAHGVPVLVGAPLTDPVHVGVGAQTLRVTISGSSHTVNANLPPSVARAELAAIVASLLRDALPTDARYATARVDLWRDRLVVVPGGLAEAITITSPAGSTLAADLGLTAVQRPGASSALISGDLASLPALTSASPSAAVAVGARPPVTFAVTPAASLAALADNLQSSINAAGGDPAYTDTWVATSGTQLLVIPGAAGTVRFSAVAGDATTVTELQLHAQYAVRARVNGAESIDAATVELPQ